jgi:origin recognition complex subunit 2
MENLKTYEKCFNQWEFELDQGFNLMFYGFGSKIDLIKKFSDKLQGKLF